LYANARGHISHLIHSHCTSAALPAERIGPDNDVQTAGCGTRSNRARTD
jgi:hypothetical protein